MRKPTPVLRLPSEVTNDSITAVEAQARALLGDYGFGSGDHANAAYILSAVVGIVVVGLAIYLIGRGVQALAGPRSTAGAEVEDHAGV